MQLNAQSRLGRRDRITQGESSTNNCLLNNKNVRFVDFDLLIVVNVELLIVE